MDQSNADRDLLFGFLALQSGFIAREELLATVGEWLEDKSEPLDRILARRESLAEEQIGLVQQLVDAHLQQHGNDLKATLASLGEFGSVWEEVQQLGDADIETSIGHITLGESAPNSDSSLGSAVGSPTTGGHRFRILRPHAKGGLGEVFVAEDIELNRVVALKEIQPSHADNQESRSRFILEAEVTGGLEHPGIVPIYGFGQYRDGRPYYAMRMIRGQSLKQAINEYHSLDKNDQGDEGARSLQLRKLLDRFIDVCNAVNYAHSRGVLHRDLKPDNVMLGKYGETLVVDWGLAKLTSKEKKTKVEDETTIRPSSGSSIAATQIGSAIGTPGYMSPEQSIGRSDELGPASDVYSLGATLYHLLTGRSPITDTDVTAALKKARRGEFPAPRQVNRLIPQALETICLKAMSLSPKERHQSAGELANDVEQWMLDEPIAVYQKEVASKQELARDHPHDLKLQEGLARSHANLGIMLHARGRYQRAVDALTASIDAYQTLVERSPLNLGYREGLANNNHYLGRVYDALHCDEEAKTAYQKAYEGYQQLVEVNPHTAGYRQERDAAKETVAKFEDIDLATQTRVAADLAEQLMVGGDVFNVRYADVRLFASGGLGQVFVAYDRVLRREVAVKQLRSEHQARLPVFLQEARILAQLQHPNIIAVYELGRLPDGAYYYTMPLVKGDSLDERIIQNHQRFRTWRSERPEWIRIQLREFINACEAIEYAHSRDIVHRDLKPANVMLGEYGETLIVDWGLAVKLVDGSVSDDPSRRAAADDLSRQTTKQGEAVGTPRYMSPEQAFGQLDRIGKTTDVYGLGATLYFILTGHPPFQQKDLFQLLRCVEVGDFPAPRTLQKGIPAPLETICLKAMALRPEDRYQSSRELAEDVERWLAGEPVSTYQSSWIDRVRKGIRGRF